MRDGTINKNKNAWNMIIFYFQFRKELNYFIQFKTLHIKYTDVLSRVTRKQIQCNHPYTKNHYYNTYMQVEYEFCKDIKKRK